MDVLILTVFISLVLVVAAVLFLIKRAKDGDFEHGDRLSLLPLDDEPRSAPPTGEEEPQSPASPGAHPESS